MEIIVLPPAPKEVPVPPPAPMHLLGPRVEELEERSDLDLRRLSIRDRSRARVELTVDNLLGKASRSHGRLAFGLENQDPFL